MSNRLRNPFKMRASEKIESDANFLKLFSPEVIDLLIDKNNKGELWENVMFIRSSPGAGKTSLLRIFDPNSLSTVYNHRSQPEYKELYQSLKKLGVINENGIKLLGVLNKSTRNYEILEDLNIEDNQKKRLFFSLLNARIILGTLKGILNLKKGLVFPTDLNKIEFSYNNEDLFLRKLQTPCDGQTLFNWASNIEKKVYEALDSFLPLSDTSIEGHDELFSIAILKPEYFKINGKTICEKFLFMIDDAHKLSINQREHLFNYITENRGNCNIWISERLEALRNFKSFIKRDYDEINLERFWSENSLKFKSILTKISNKRASISTEDVTFFENLENEIDEEKYKTQIENVIIRSKTKIENIAKYSPKFIEWVSFINEKEENTYETAILCKGVEILMNRNLGKSQLSFDFPLTLKELNLDSSILNTAELFIAQEFKFPYYYGFNNIITLSSNNIEQFLSFASELYEGMISNKISGSTIQLNIEKQDKLLKDIVNKKWKELKILLPDSKLVINFLENLGNYFNKITYKPTASYAPGINGFAIKPDQRLFNEKKWSDDNLFSQLSNVLSICLSFNLLEIKEVMQGDKGQNWEVYYFNRWLCVKFNLPLNYGGWNKLTPDELLIWTTKSQ